MAKDVNQDIILEQFKKWLKIQIKKDTGLYNEKVVKDIIASFERGYCSGFSWIHRVRRHRGEEALFFHQLGRIARWNGSKRTLDTDLDKLFNQLLQVTIIAHQAWATDAALSIGHYAHAGTSLEDAVNAIRETETIRLDQHNALIGRLLGNEQEAFVITSDDPDYVELNKEAAKQKIGFLFEDAPNAMLHVSGRCYSKRDDPSKHEYHSIDMGVTEVSGQRKYWLYDPNHPKGIIYYNNFDDLFAGLQKAFFYKRRHHNLPLMFQRYENLNFVQNNQEIELEIHRNPHRTRHKRAKQKSRQNTFHVNYQSRRAHPRANGKFDRDKIHELENIIQQAPVHTKIELGTKEGLKSVHVEKLEEGFSIVLEEGKEGLIVHNLKELFNKIKKHDHVFWQEMDIATLFTQKFTEDSKKKASLELEMAIKNNDVETVKWLIQNGALDEFTPQNVEKIGHNALTLALSSSGVSSAIVEMIIKYDKQHHLNLAEHIYLRSGAENSGFNVLWFAALSSNKENILLLSQYYPELNTFPTLTNGAYAGLTPLHAAILFKSPPDMIQALLETHPEMVSRKIEGKPFENAKDIVEFSKMSLNHQPETIRVLSEYLEKNKENSVQKTVASKRTLR